MATPTFLKVEFSDLETCIGIAKKIHQNTGGSCSFNEFSSIVGNKTTSSWFTLKLNAMKAYGFVLSEGDQIKLTKLGDAVSAPIDANQYEEANIRALENFPFFTALGNRYKGRGEPEPKYVVNVLLQENKVKQDKAHGWAECFLKAARYAGLFSADLKVRTNGEGSPARDPLGEGEGDKGEESKISPAYLSENEAKQGWLVYPVPVPNGLARIIVPRNLPRSAWERLKRLLDAIEPERQEDLKT